MGWFSKKKTVNMEDIVEGRGWAKVNGDSYRKCNLQLDMSSDRMWWKIVDLMSGARMSGDLDSLSEGLEFSERYVRVL